MEIIFYSKEVKEAAAQLLQDLEYVKYEIERRAINETSDEEGCGAVFVLCFPPLP